MAITSPRDDKKIWVQPPRVLGVKDSDGNYRLHPLELRGILDTQRAIIKKLQGGITYSDLTSLTVEALTATTVITENLYATFGDVAELTVDRLMTGDKVYKYLAYDTSDVNYINIQDKTISFITASTDGSTTEQLTDRDGNPVYWNSPGATTENYKTIGMTTTNTGYPVTIYEYAELIKLKISFELDPVSGYYAPAITLGAGWVDEGTGQTREQAVIYKGTNGLEISHVAANGTESTIQMDKYVDASMRRISSVTLNRTAGTVSVLMEEETTPISLGLAETDTSVTLTYPDSFTSTLTIAS